MEERKPLGRKSYGHIPHLPNSRMGPGDHQCHEGQARIATLQKRDKYDYIFVTEKLDGSNVGIARIGENLYPLTRAGYLANTSPYEQHHKFSDWLYNNYERCLKLLNDGERLCCEWLIQAHGTRYNLPHEPIVCFDIMINDKRLPYNDTLNRLEFKMTTPTILSIDKVLTVQEALRRLGEHGNHGALDLPEGAVWRVEHKEKFDFMVKYVRPDKEDGIYLSERSGKDPYWNEYKEDKIQWVRWEVFIEKNERA